MGVRERHERGLRALRRENDMAGAPLTAPPLMVPMSAPSRRRPPHAAPRRRPATPQPESQSTSRRAAPLGRRHAERSGNPLPSAAASPAYEANSGHLAGWDIRALRARPDGRARHSARGNRGARGRRPRLPRGTGVERAVAAGYPMAKFVTTCSDMQFRYPRGQRRAASAGCSWRRLYGAWRRGPPVHLRLGVGALSLGALGLVRDLLYAREARASRRPGLS